MSITNGELRTMAEIAKIHWLFDEDTDPDGTIAKGIEYLASEGDFDEEVIEAHVKDSDDWDGLSNWAAFYGQA